MKRRSRLDLYFRSFAFLGLGVLAVSAALVDGLPGAVDLPRVPSPFTPQDRASVQTAIELPGFPLSSSRVEIAATASRVDRPAPTSRRPDTEPAVRQLVASDEIPDSVVLPGALALPVFLESVAALQAPTVELSALLTIVDVWQPTATPVTMAADRSTEGFFPGVLKRTGSTVGTSIGKAGSSMLNAARAVGGAVRRAF